MQGYALITGASSGIGEAMAHRLAAQGWPLVVVSHDAEGNQRVADTLRQTYGVDVRLLTLDLARPQAAEELFAWCEGWGIEVELLVSNAGILQWSRLEHTPLERLEQLVNLHCQTPQKLCRLWGERMVQRGHGYILLVSSITAWMPYPTLSHYAATKAFLKSFGRSLWYEMRGRGVRVCTLFPSAVDTPLYGLSEQRRRWLRRLGLMLSADRVARTALRALMRGRSRSLPGFWTKVEAALCWMMPAWMLLPILKLPAVRRILERL